MSNIQGHQGEANNGNKNTEQNNKESKENATTDFERE